jgi:nicotinate-nucleotide adenylyltransferase
MKIGVLGGTFDPVHLGHVRMAEEARDALGLEQVILVPAGQPMSKPDRNITPAEHRIEMLRLAVKDKPRLTISAIETERPGPSFTIDTITELQQKYGAGAVMCFILGWDSLEQVPEWHEPARLVKMCYLVAIPRPGCKLPDFNDLEKNLPGISQKVICLQNPCINISATAIREKVALGESIDKLVPKAVAVYIKKNNLYRATGGKQ